MTLPSDDLTTLDQVLILDGEKTTIINICIVVHPV